jgi:hypothetical protein
MKLLFTADLHIKLGQKNVPIDWARDRYHKLFQQLSYHSGQAALTVIGGDIFDKVPSMEELELYFYMLEHLNSPSVIYSGNHEAVKKNTTFLTNLKRASVFMNNKYKVTVIDDFATIMGIDFIPYNKLKEPWPDTLKSNILCTHVRGEIPPHVKSEIDLTLLDSWQVVLAGDLHSYTNSQRNILYPGSPLTTSFHRNTVDTGIILLDTVSLEHEWIKLELPQLIRKTIQVGEPMPATDYHHTIYEVEGDMASLSGLEDSELLDKKVSKRVSDTSLILSAEMSLLEEVKEYLLYILELDDATVESVLKELQDL